MKPIEYFQQQIDAGLIQQDPQQLEVMQILQRIYDDLVEEQQKTPRLLKRIIKKPQQTIKGLYAWGSVGVGKTFLMDCFYLCCPVKKMRLHFHVFMQRIHQELKLLQGEKDPLRKVAKKLIMEAKVLCFDEFFVTDIADAMILGELFDALFAEGICLITTSNVAPSDLYKEGLQRERFLPTIKLIKQHTTVFHMISHHDYRLTHLSQAGVYFTPLDHQSEVYMENAFQHLASGQEIIEGDIELFGRKIKIRKRTADIIWFDFKNICGVPRSQKDYIALSKQYHTVFISGIPVLKPNQLDLTTLFINLIDVFYDANVRLVVSAAADIEHLYPDGRLRFEFARTQSRLIEMQSTDYFNKRSR